LDNKEPNEALEGNRSGVLMRIADARRLGILTTALCVTLSAGDWQSNVKKKWQFALQQGTVNMALLIDPALPNVSSVSLWYEGGAHPSIAEEAGFIHQILRQLPGLGINPHSLSAITMRGCAEPEVQQGLAIAALHSQAWRLKKKSPEGLMQDLLNSIGAYNGFNTALEEYGLVVSRVGSAEKVGTEPCKDLKLADSICAAHPNRQVPTSANLYVEIVPKGKDQGKVPAATRGNPR